MNLAVIRKIPALFKESFAKWKSDNAMRMAASLAYYTAFSLAPLVLAAIAVAGLIFGEDAARGRIYLELKGTLGPSIAASVEELVKAASKPVSGIWGALLSFALVLFGASGVFGELKESLNGIWKASPRKGNGIWIWIRGRFLSIGMVLGVCFLLLVSLVINAGLGVVADYGLKMVPGAPLIMQAIGMIFSLLFVMVLFAMMFKYLPDTYVAWRDVWIGSAVTAILFTLGKTGLEIYISKSAVSSGYGAAGALALVLVWVYFSAQIFLLGAEFTQVYAEREGSRASVPAAKVEAVSHSPVIAPPATGPVPAVASSMEPPVKTAGKILGIDKEKKLKPVEQAGRAAGAGIVLAISRAMERMGRRKRGV
jgi:membrane protein